MLNFNCQS